MAGRSLVPPSTAPTPYAPPADGLAALAAAGGEGGGAPSSPFGVEPRRPPLRRYMDALRRHKWILVAAAMLGTGAGVAASRVVKPEYEAAATIFITTTSEESQTSGPIRAAELLRSSAWIDLLRSYAVTDSVVNTLRLYVTPRYPTDSVLFRTFARSDALVPGHYVLHVVDGGRYTLELEKHGTIETGAIGDSVGRSRGFQWAPPPAALHPGQDVPFQVQLPREAAMALNKRLQSVIPRESNFLRLTLTGEDPASTTRILNEWASQFVASAASYKKRGLVEFTHILQGQLEFAQAELQRAEIALEGFRARTIILPSEGTPVAGGVGLTQDPVLQSYFSQRTMLEDVKHDRQLLQRIVGELRAGSLSAEAVASLPRMSIASPALEAASTELLQKKAQLRTLRQTFTDEHPTVRAAQAGITQLERETIPQLAQGLLQQLAAREVDMQGRVSSAGRELERIPSRTIEEMRLRRQVSVSENLYNTLKSRYEVAKLAEASSVPDVAVHDSAVVPQLPSKNTAPMLVVLGLVGGLGLAAAFAILRDMFDRRFRYADQVTHDLGLLLVGAVPQVPRRRSAASDVEVTSQLLESFRSLRLTVRYALDGRQPLSVVVTSPNAQDGKSFVSANLALSFADAGYRTLLIDGDLRRGQLHTNFGIAQTPGLTEYLSGTAELPDVLREGTCDNLTLLPCGTRARRAPELLSSARMTALLAQLQRDYDVVVMDTPPLGAGMDAFALGAMIGNVLVVLRTDHSDRKLAESKLRIIDRLPIRVVGAVVNGAPLKGDYQYYSYFSEYAGVDGDGPGGASSDRFLGGSD